MTNSELTTIAKELRYLILQITQPVSSGHPTSAFSSIELATVLFFKHLKFDLENPDYIGNDRAIFSKGHASALLYSLYAVAGKISYEELHTYRNFNSVLEGHPTHRFLYTEAATGSLGQGISIGAGEAIAIQKKFTSATNIPHVFVLVGDGEMAEGSNYEALAWASHQRLSNLHVIVDINKYGQSQETMYAGAVEEYKRKFEAFNWGTIIIEDGHDIEKIDHAYHIALETIDKPTVLLAKTIKGKGIDHWEDKDGWHNKMLPDDLYKRALELFKVEPPVRGVIQKPQVIEVPKLDIVGEAEQNYRFSFSQVYTSGDLVPTKKAFGNALEFAGSIDPLIIVLDADVSNSVHTDQFKKKYPDRFLQMYIAEQNMVGVATGLAKRGYKPIVSTFACFLTRAADQIRMIHLTGASVIIHGSYVGVSLGRDGPSQMGLSDISQFRSLPDSVVVYPSDPYMTEYLFGQSLIGHGVHYIRTTREATPVIYTQDDVFPIGGSKVFKSERNDAASYVTIVSAGITLHESLKAQKILEESGIGVHVIDCYSIKPIDIKTIVEVSEGSKALIVVEDHYPEGGLGEAVMASISTKNKVPIHHLSVTKVPMSGSAQELLHYEGLDSENIISKIKVIL